MAHKLTVVAEKVGVSEATVSRVLNGRPGVSAATRTAVLTALDVLGYERPTKLRGKRARLVGLVLPELGNPIFPALAEVVGGALAQGGFTPVLCASGPNGLSEPDYVNMLLDQHASGVIFAGGNFAEADSSHAHYQLLRERALPVVLVNASSDDLAFAQVSTDDTVATEQAFNHLRTLGHETVGMILGPEDHMPSRFRLAAFEKLTGSVAAGGPSRVEHVPFSLEAGHAAGGRLVGRGTTGIICASDPLALGAVRAVRRLGLRVPEDVSIVGYDDSALMMCTDPPLTTIRQPIESMGRAAVKLLASQIDGTTATPERLLFEPELVVRGSTAPPAARANPIASPVPSGREPSP
ncbi:MAG TPA: LacI family DNA-binding transcriptional regulator [Acidimicrobiales bacterium]|nr:LacI family DNA-binding transcriptional regulator [Acidimicrobiales bacterium]